MGGGRKVEGGREGGGGGGEGGRGGKREVEGVGKEMREGGIDGIS